MEAGTFQQVNQKADINTRVKSKLNSYRFEASPILREQLRGASEMCDMFIACCNESVSPPSSLNATKILHIPVKWPGYHFKGLNEYTHFLKASMFNVLKLGKATYFRSIFGIFVEILITSRQQPINEMG